MTKKCENVDYISVINLGSILRTRRKNNVH